MESFDTFLEQQVIDEATLKANFLEKAKKLSDKITSKAKRLMSGLSYERDETLFMMETFFTQLKEILEKEKTVTEDDVKRALFQLRDIGKFSLIAPLFILPGGGTTTTVLYLTAKKLFGISILPKGLESVFEMVYDMRNALENINEQLEQDGMKDFESYSKDALDESSLSRIWKHVQDHQAGAISGYRDENSRTENKQNNREIKAYLMRKGYGVTSVQGNYIENFGSDNQREVGEPSFFVVDLQDNGRLEYHLAALGQRFDQDSVLIVPQGGKGAYLLGTSKRDDAFPSYGNKEVVGRSRFGKVAGEFLSRIRGREFAFESVEWPGTVNGKRGWIILANKVDNELREREE